MLKGKKLLLLVINQVIEVKENPLLLLEIVLVMIHRGLMLLQLEIMQDLILKVQKL